MVWVERYALSRCISKESGFASKLEDWPERTPTLHRWSRIVKHKAQVILRFLQIGWVKVRLPGRSKSLTMVAFLAAGSDVPLMLLRIFRPRAWPEPSVFCGITSGWECKEGMQLFKEQVNLELIRTFRWSAICQLVLLAVVVMSYLAWLIERHPRLTDRLIEYVQVLADEADFLFYRVL